MTHTIGAETDPRDLVERYGYVPRDPCSRQRVARLVSACRALVKRKQDFRRACAVGIRMHFALTDHPPVARHPPAPAPTLGVVGDRLVGWRGSVSGLPRTAPTGLTFTPSCFPQKVQPQALELVRKHTLYCDVVTDSYSARWPQALVWVASRVSFQLSSGWTKVSKQALPRTELLIPPTSYTSAALKRSVCPAQELALVI